MKTIHHGVGAYNHGVTIGPSQWPHHDLIVILRGTVVIHSDNRKILCEKDSALLIPPNFSFEGFPGAAGCVIWVKHFSPSRNDKTGKLPLRPTLWNGAAKREWPRTLLRAIQTRYASADSRSSEIPHLLILLLISVQKNCIPDYSIADARVEKVMELAIWLQNQAHPLPTIDSLARRCGWSPSHFRAEFRRHLGSSAGCYLREMRLREAARLLKESTMPIKMIATHLGYGEVVAFHRAFLAFHGQTPAHYSAQLPKVM